MVREISPWTLDHLVFNKPYFDRRGFLVAERDGQVIGFAHASFGPNELGSAIDFELGVTQMLLVDTTIADRNEVAKQLLAASEEYQRTLGARLMYAGGIKPMNAFYLGLYGGSELPGVLESDPTLPWFQDQGYTEVDRVQVLQCYIHRFRPPVDRRLLQVRRRYTVEAAGESKPGSWWEACTAPPTDVLRFQVLSRDGGPACGSVGFWHIEPLATDWGTTAVGLIEMEIAPPFQRHGIATFLCCEAIKLIQPFGIQMIEVQTMVSNKAALGLYEKLGFQRIEQGVVLRKK